MATNPGGPAGVLGVVQASWRQVVLVLLALGCVPAVLANGPGENSTWQFQTTQERVNKAAIADLVEKKQAGYYDSGRVRIFV